MRRERKLSKDNGQFLYCLNEETDTSDCMVIRQMQSIRRIKDFVLCIR